MSIQTNRLQDQITSHEAWVGNIKAEEAAQRLEGQEPFTYVLRGEEGAHPYFMSLVNQNGKVKHISIDLGERGVYHQNGQLVGPAKDINILVQQLITILTAQRSK